MIQCADRLKTEQNRAETAAIQSAKAATGSARWRLGVRIAAGAGVVLVLLLVRHWFLGGAVPFLREPKKFEIDPASLDPVTITNRPGVSPGAPLAVDAESI